MYKADRSQPLLQESQDQLHAGKVLATGGAMGGEGVDRYRRTAAASHKANWPDLNAEFLVCAAHIHGGKVYDGQACHILGSVFEDGLAHISIPFLGLKGAAVNRVGEGLQRCQAALLSQLAQPMSQRNALGAEGAANRGPAGLEDTLPHCESGAALPLLPRMGPGNVNEEGLFAFHMKL